MLGRLIMLIAVWEGGWWAWRVGKRANGYRAARERADQLGRPLVVIGAPDGGATAGYPCGDVTIDIQRSGCPNSLQLDVTKRLPFDDDSVVVFVSCVLEIVSDPNAALSELMRISGGNLFLVRVEPWTATRYLYPGMKHTLPPAWTRIG